mgnify:FL=1
MSISGAEVEERRASRLFLFCTPPFVLPLHSSKCSTSTRYAPVHARARSSRRCSAPLILSRPLVIVVEKPRLRFAAAPGLQPARVAHHARHPAQGRGWPQCQVPPQGSSPAPGRRRASPTFDAAVAVGAARTARDQQLTNPCPVLVADVHHCDHRYAAALLSVCRLQGLTNASRSIGPKTNSVEMITKLRVAGVNVGAPLPVLRSGGERLPHFLSSYELLARILRVPPVGHRQHQGCCRSCVALQTLSSEARELTI